MSKRLALVLIGVVTLALGGAITAAEKPPESYVKAMKDLGGVAQGADKAVKAEDYDALKKYADSAREAFVVVETYWNGKDAEAVKTAQAGKKGAQDLGVAAGLMSQDGAAEAVKDITGTCASCHKTHREKLEDGSYQIK